MLFGNVISTILDLESRSLFNPFEGVGKHTFPKEMWVCPALVTSHSFVWYTFVCFCRKSLTEEQGNGDLGGKKKKMYRRVLFVLFSSVLMFVFQNEK